MIIHAYRASTTDWPVVSGFKVIVARQVAELHIFLCRMLLSVWRHWRHAQYLSLGA